MSDKAGEKTVKKAADTSSESSPSGSSDEVAETRDDFEHLKLAKNEEESEESKETRKEGAGSPIRKTSSTEEPPESKPGPSRQPMQQNPGDDSHSEGKNVLPGSSGMQKPASQDSEDSSERDVMAAKSDQKSIDYAKMPYRNVVEYFLRDESISREETPSAEGNTLSDVSEICTQAASGSSMEGSVYQDAPSSVKSEPSLYHDASSSVKSEPSVYHDAPSSVKSDASVSLYRDALESQSADNSDSTSLSALPSLSSNAPSDVTVSTPTEEQGNAAYIARLEREARERSDPTSTSSGIGSTNLSELDNIIDWMEEGERIRIPRPRPHQQQDIVVPRDDEENLDRENLQSDRSTSESTSEEQGHAAYLAELDREARKFKVPSSSSDTSSADHSDLANIQKWFNVGKQMAKESSSGSSLEQVGGDAKSLKSEMHIPMSSHQVPVSERSTPTGKEVLHLKYLERQASDSSSSSETNSAERSEMEHLKKWLSVGGEILSRHVSSEKGFEAQEEKRAYESSSAEKNIECSIKDERSDSSSSTEPMSTSTSDFSRGLGSSTESTEPEGATMFRGNMQLSKLGSQHKLQYATIARIETIEEEKVTPLEVELATDAKPTFKKPGTSPEQMEHDSPERIEEQTTISEAFHVKDKTSYSISPVDPRSTVTLESSREVESSIEPMETDEASKYPESKKSWQKSGSLRTFQHATISSIESTEEEKIPLSGRETTESRLSKDSSSSIEPMSIETSDFSHSIASSTGFTEQGGILKFEDAEKSSQKSDYMPKPQYATIVHIETTEEEKVTPLGIEEPIMDESTFKEFEMSPEQMEVSSPSPKAMEQESPERVQLDEIEAMQSESEQCLKNKLQSEETHATLSEASDAKDERSDSRLSSSSLEPLSTSTSEFSHGLGSSTESTEPDGTSGSRSTRKSSPKPTYQHKVQYATIVRIETIEEETVTPIGIQAVTDVELTLGDSRMSPEQREAGSPVEQELVPESTRKDEANETATAGEYGSQKGETVPETPDLSTNAPIQSGSSVPLAKSETRPGKTASASCESKSQIGKRTRKKAKLDKDKKVKHSKSAKKRARRRSSGSLSESTGELSGSESDYSTEN